MSNSLAAADYLVRMPWSAKTVTDAMTTGLIAATCVGLLWAAFSTPRGQGRTLPPIPKEPLSLDGAAVKGSAAAPVVVIEFADYQCPACNQFQKDTMPRLDAAYVNTGRVRWAFRHRPIEKLHREAVDGARAAICAGAQSKFWEMHQALFADPKNMDRPSLVRRAEAIGLEGPMLADCLNEASVARSVAQDIEHAVSLALKGTPAFLVGRREADGRVRVTRVMLGAARFDDFKSAIDAALEGPGLRGTEVAAVTGIGTLGVALAIIGLRRARRRRELAPTADIEV